MSDNDSFIIGTAKGAFADAYEGLPPWATEDTAIKMEKLLRKSFQVNTEILQQLKDCCTGSGNGGGMTSSDSEKLQDALDNLAKSLAKQNANNVKKPSPTGGGSTTGSDVLTKVFAGIATIGTKVLGVFTDYIDVYDSMYRSGINLMNGSANTTSGFAALNQMITLTGVRLQTLQAVAEKYSTTMNSVGMLKFSKAVSMANTQLRNMGYYGENQLELVAALMEAESGYADIRNKTAEELSRDSLRLGDQFARLSQTVGLSRQQLQESMKATAKSTEASFAFAIYGKDAADKLNRSMAGIKDENLKKTMMELAVAPNASMVKGYMDLVSSGMGDVAELLRSTSKQALTADPAEFQAKLSEMASYLEKQTGRMAAQSYQMNSSTASGADLLNRMLIEGRSKSQASTTDVKNAAATQGTIANLKSEQERTLAIPAMLSHPLESQVEIAANVLKTFNDAVISSALTIDSSTRSWIGVGLVVAGLVTSFIGVTKIVNMFSKLFSTGPASTIPAAASSIGSAFSAVGSFVLRFLGRLTIFYTALQLAEAIGETIYETVTGVKVKINILGSIVDTLWSILKSAGTALSDGFTSFVDALWGGIKSAGSSIAKGLAPFTDALWSTLGSIGSTISEGFASFGKRLYDFAPGLYDFTASYFSNLFDFIGKVVTKFTSKMTFGLVGGDSPKMTVPKSPAPSSVQSPASVTPAPAVPTTPGVPAQVGAVSPQATRSPSDINSLLVSNGVLLEQILSGTRDLVSVNKEILKYARNSA